MNTTDHLNFLNTAREYELRYRARQSAPFLYHEHPYALYPATDEEYGWPDYYPFAEEAGVYAGFDIHGRLIYVGKASMGNTIGNRLGARFQGSQKCIAKGEVGSWQLTATHIATIAMPRGYEFEAPALEEYLIKTLQPKLNKPGKTKV